MCDRQKDQQAKSKSGFIQASMSRIQGLLQASPTVFKGLKLMKNTDLSVQILLQKCLTEVMETLVLEISIKLLCFYLVQHKLHQIKAQQFYTD